MCLCSNLTIDNCLSIISIFFVLIGGLYAFYKWHSSLKIKRAEFINQILEKLIFNDNLTKTMYIIDYNPTWYNENFHNSGSFESSIDKLLSYLDYICYLKATRNISEKEFKILKYKIHRTCISPSVQSYLWNLFHFSKKNGTECSFQYLINYGIESGIIKTDFKKNNTSLFSKKLNF